MLVLSLADSSAHANCGAENCPLDNSSLGDRGRKLTFEMSYQQVVQGRIWARDHEVSLAQVYAAGGELFTRSRMTMGKALYSFGARGAISASLPYVYRIHRHVSTEGLPEPELREWQYGGLGDMTVLGNWNLVRVDLPSPLSVSVQGGVKLPTGRRHVPGIAGEEPEPHARPGTGSTDLLGGLQFVQAVRLPGPGGVSAPTRFFASALYTHTNKGTEGHRVGRMLDAQLGAGYPITGRFQLLAQTNCWLRGRDHVDVATEAGGHTGHAQSAARGRPGVSPEHEVVTASGDVDNTGGTTVFASPGLRFQANPGIALSAYVQIPLYQRVNGTQVVSSSQFWLGATQRLW